MKTQAMLTPLVMLIQTESVIDSGSPKSTSNQFALPALPYHVRFMFMKVGFHCSLAQICQFDRKQLEKGG
jgi:hypothetical protein